MPDMLADDEFGKAVTLYRNSALSGSNHICVLIYWGILVSTLGQAYAHAR